MRLWALATLLACSSPAFADPADRLEATGFLGVEDYAKDIGLGGALWPEQRPQTSPTFGLRLTYFPLQTPGDIHVDLGTEAELSFTPAWTGYGFDTMRPSYFAPVLGYRANLMLRLGGRWVQPHVIGGFGAATLAANSPFMKAETDPVFVWGVGAAFAVGGGWQIRFDARQMLTEAMCTGAGDTCPTAASYELLVGVGMRFGKQPAQTTPTEHVEIVQAPPPPPPPEPVRDSDNDGITDKLDACPQQAETVNGVDDQDGCPEADPDGDKIVGAADKCPDQAEDFDKFEDEDGCPDPDNDKDGIADAADKCPNEAETKNGIADTDGCPDQIPPGIVEALSTATKAKFDPNSVRISSRVKAALDKALLIMLNNPKLKFVITVHPDQEGDKSADVARRRAENLKGYLSEQGVAMGSLTTAVGTPAKDPKAPVVEITIAP